MSQWTYKGIVPAMQCPFRPDYSIDEPELRRFTAWLARHEGIAGLTTNGHTGEVFALSAKERAQVRRIVADEVKGKLPVISGICCEGNGEAVEHALMAKEAGASALLVMPPHMWLRFGMKPEHVVEHFSEVGKASGLDLFVHIYPSWTRAAYSSGGFPDSLGPANANRPGSSRGGFHFGDAGCAYQRAGGVT